MSKTPEYLKKASASYRARQKAAGKVQINKWVYPDLLKQILELIKNYKG